MEEIPQITDNGLEPAYNQFIIDYNKRVDLKFNVRALDAIVKPRPGEIIVLGGRPSEGKSSLATGWAHDWAKLGKRVLYFSNEETKGEIAVMMIARQTKIDNEYIRNNTLTPQMRQQIAACCADIKKLPLCVLDDMEGCDIVKIGEAIGEFKPDIFVIDHMQMVQKENSYQPTHEAMGDFMSRIRSIVKKHQSTAVLLSQCNRGTEERKSFLPSVADLKGSGAIEERANQILLFAWPWKHYAVRNIKGEKIDHEQWEYYIQIAKNRGGRIGIAKGRIYPQFNLVTNEDNLIGQRAQDEAFDREGA